MLSRCVILSSSAGERTPGLTGAPLLSLSVLQDASLLPEVSLRDVEQKASLQLPPVSDFRESPWEPRLPLRELQGGLSGTPAGLLCDRHLRALV